MSQVRNRDARAEWRRERCRDRLAIAGSAWTLRRRPFYRRRDSTLLRKPLLRDLRVPRLLLRFRFDIQQYSSRLTNTATFQGGISAFMSNPVIWNPANTGKAILTAALLIAVGALAMNRGFYKSSIVDVFMSLSLCAALVTLFVVQPSWINLAFVTSCALILAAIDYRLMGYP